MKRLHNKKTARSVMATVIILVIIVSAPFWYLKKQDNSHPITPGEAYRSAVKSQFPCENG